MRMPISVRSPGLCRLCGAVGCPLREHCTVQYCMHYRAEVVYGGPTQMPKIKNLCAPLDSAGSGCHSDAPTAVHIRRAQAQSLAQQSLTAALASAPGAARLWAALAQALTNCAPGEAPPAQRQRGPCRVPCASSRSALTATALPPTAYKQKSTTALLSSEMGTIPSPVCAPKRLLFPTSLGQELLRSA